MFHRTQNVLKFFFLFLSASRQMPWKYLNFDFNNFLPNHFKLSFILDAAYFEMLKKALNNLKGILRCVIPVVCRIDHTIRCMPISSHNYALGGMLFTICKAQLHVSAINVSHLQVVQCKLIDHIYMHL